jgi:tetratricopeptide (TPR) repeat protein
MVDAASERVEARQLAERATQLDKDDPLVLAMSGHTYSYVLEEPENGAIFLARAVALDPNLAAARYWYGWAQIYLGNVDAAIEQFTSAIRLSPLDPRLFVSQAVWHTVIFLPTGTKKVCPGPSVPSSDSQISRAHSK